MTTIVSGSQIQFNDNTTQNTSAYGGGFAFRNRIINGGMVIDQRNAGASITVNSTSNSFPCDRFLGSGTNSAGVYTIQQVSDAPTGFTNSLKITTTTASASLGSSADYLVGQKIEGFNFADMQWGTANAQTVTLSFRVKSSLTGTFAGVLANSAWDRSYVFTYVISAANTWETKTITIAGDTTGTWVGATNGTGLRIFFSMGSGSSYVTTANTWTSGTYETVSGATNVISTLSATWQITGVQLEKGSTATSFDYRPYGQELALCQRYCNVYGENAYSVFGSMGYGFSATGFSSATLLPVEMRAVPTVSYTGNTRAVDGNNGIAVTSAAFNTSNSSKKIAVVELTVASGITTYRGYYWSANNDTTARVTFSAEL